MDAICFLDTETDGVHHGRQAWEIGLIRVDGTGRHELTFMLDIDLSAADPFGLAVGRFYERHPLGRDLSQRDAQDPEYLPATVDPTVGRREAARRIARYTHGATIVGLVPSFDTEVCADLLRAEQLRPGWHYHLQDVESVALGWLSARGKLPWPGTAGESPLAGPPWRSDELSKACRVEPPSDTDRHTALGDALWAERWWVALGMPYPEVAL